MDRYTLITAILNLSDELGDRMSLKELLRRALIRIADNDLETLREEITQTGVRP